MPGYLDTHCRTGTHGRTASGGVRGHSPAPAARAEAASLAREGQPGRERDDETILFWHRGLSLSDIALGHAMLEKARRLGIGQELRCA